LSGKLQRYSSVFSIHLKTNGDGADVTSHCTVSKLNANIAVQNVMRRRTLHRLRVRGPLRGRSFALQSMSQRDWIWSS